MTQPAKPKPRRRLTHEVAGVFSARALFSLLGMLSGIILARWLGPHDRGILAMVLLLPATAVSFAKLGISPANVFFINRHGVSSTRAASNSAGIAAITGAIILLAVWFLREPIMTRWLPGLPPWALAIAALRIPLQILDNYLYGVLQAEGLFSLYNTRLVRGEAIRFLLIVGALVFLGFGLFAAVVIHTLMTFINIGWLIYTVRRQIPFTMRIDPKLTASQLRFGIKSYLQILAQHLLLRISMFMVASFLGAAQLAFYSIAVRLTELIIEIPQAVGLVLYPRLASLPDERMHRVTAQACRRTLMMTTAAALGLVSVGRFLIHLWYGAPYAPAAEPAPVARGGRAGHVGLRHPDPRFHQPRPAAGQHRRGVDRPDRQHRPQRCAHSPTRDRRGRGLHSRFLHGRLRGPDGGLLAYLGDACKRGTRANPGGLRLLRRDDPPSGSTFRRRVTEGEALGESKEQRRPNMRDCPGSGR